MTQTALLKMYFDGSCYLCSTEVEHYRKKDVLKKIEFIDIMDPRFNASKEGLDAKKIQRLMHVKNLQTGEIVTDVAAFIAVWNVIPRHQVLAKIAGLPLVRSVLRLGYFIFALFIRRWLPKKRNCYDGTCER